MDLLQSCLGSQAPGSSRVKDTCVHAGPVSCIVISAGRAYTAGGSSGASAALLVWDSSRFELLRTISKRSTRWCRWVYGAIVMALWLCCCCCGCVAVAIADGCNRALIRFLLGGWQLYSGPSAALLVLGAAADDQHAVNALVQVGRGAAVIML